VVSHETSRLYPNPIFRLPELYATLPVPLSFASIRKQATSRVFPARPERPKVSHSCPTRAYFLPPHATPSSPGQGVSQLCASPCDPGPVSPIPPHQHLRDRKHNGQTTTSTPGLDQAQELRNRLMREEATIWKSLCNARTCTVRLSEGNLRQRSTRAEPSTKVEPGRYLFGCSQDLHT